ncbi:MAG: hypothetical protein VX737_03025 [Pseudomonadota bacterium]|nr:hypothetical protein [Pseudomonadota bacterium]
MGKSPKLDLTPRQKEVVDYTLSFWKKQKYLSKDAAKELSQSINVIRFDWDRCSKYAFWVASICFIIAVVNFLGFHFVQKFMYWMEAGGTALFFGLLAVVFFAAGVFSSSRYPENTYMSEASHFLGVFFTSSSLVFLFHALGVPHMVFYNFLLVSFFLYAVIAFCTGSRLVWVFSLLSMGSWLGHETAYINGLYVLSLSLPLVTCLYGVVLTTAAVFFRDNTFFARFYLSTAVLGLVYLFISLWVLSLSSSVLSFFGFDMGRLFWSLVFAFAALVALWHGLKYDHAITRGFGCSFLLINLYTQYFSYCYHLLPKAVFFLILAISFWALGCYSETFSRQMNRLKGCF